MSRAALRYDLSVPGTEQLIDTDHTADQAHAGGRSDIILVPQPTSLAADPLNWSSLKKYYQLFLLSLYACAFSYGENTLGAAWTEISEETGVTLTNMNGGSALNYLLLGLTNVFWISAALKFGRRPVFLATTVLCMCTGFWLGKFSGTAQWMANMALNGIGTSAYQAVIQLSIFDTFFAHERGRMLSVYLFGQQLGSILGLITGGAIADRIGWRWSQYIVGIIDASVLLLFIFTFEETAFPRFLFTRLEGVVPARDAEPTPSELDDDKHEPAKLKMTPTAGTTHTDVASLHGPEILPRTYLEKLKPWTYFPEDQTSFWVYVRRPFLLFTVPNIVIAGFIFAFGCTAGIVSFNTISSILSEPPYNFSTTATGLVFFAALIGSIIGWATGVLSDFIVLFLARRNRGVREPEMRLWTLCISFVYAGVGYMMYGWGAQAGLSWVVVAFGLGCMIAHQVSACTIATAYAMECFPGISGELVVVLAICSSIINFALSYSIQPFIEATGFGYAFLFYGLCVMGSMVAAVPTCIWGKQWRKNAAPRWARWLAEREGR